MPTKVRFIEGWGGEGVFYFYWGVDQTVFSYSQQLTTHLQKLFKRSCVPELDRLLL
jgi:hypothetical protein